MYSELMCRDLLSIHGAIKVMIFGEVYVDYLKSIINEGSNKIKDVEFEMEWWNNKIRELDELINKDVH